MSETDVVSQQPTLNDVPVTPEQLKEEKNNLPGNQRIVEVDPGKFRKLERLRD